jgi:subtilisin family serine protease
LGIVGAVVVAVVAGALIMSGLASGPASRARNNDVSPSAQRGPQTGVLANGAKTRAGSPASSHAPYRAGAVLVSFRLGVSGASQTTIERAAGALDARRLGPAVRRVGAPGAGRQLALAPILLRVPSSGVLSAVRTLRGDPHVAYAEPDYLMHASATPNDPSFALQWAANNTGQSIPTQNAEEVQGPPANGTAGADDRALAAWGVSTGSRSIVIGETDTGVNYNHADLASNVWTNPGGIGGCAAGTRGYNVLNSTCEPMDDDTAYGGHGTHVAGIMGAVGNNGVGVAGMNWQTSILPVKWLNSSASGSTSGLIAALQWLVAAKQAGVNLRVVNDSATFVGTAYSQALSEEIDTLGANNILFVTAAGNTGDNNDLEAVRRYPCGYDRPNEICATASDNNDSLPSWANYGSHTVDLAAPGVSVYSTLRNGGYGYLSGGSMASPQVAGAAALILSVSPSLSPSALKSDILENVDKLPSLAGKVITGGRLDVCKALPGCTTPPPTLTFGKTTVGASSDSFLADRKRVSRYSLSAAGSVTKLSMYLAPTGTSGQQVLKGLVYADASGKPGALVGVSEQLTFKSTNAAGWYDLVFSSPLKLAAGTYWIGAMTGASSNVAGFRYDNVAASRDYNANTYTSGPSDPFGSVSTDGEQASLYATYRSQSLPPPPANTAPPTISGTAQQGQTLTEAHGTWTNSPTNFTYQWLQCDSSGNACTAIAKAISQTYAPVAADVGHTLKVQETAANQGGPGAPASSGATGVVKASPPPPPPANTTPPTVSGTAQQGQTLTEAHGSWTNSPTGYTYQWLQCDSSGNGCTAIAKATSQTYVPAAEDVGHTLRVQETAANEGGPSSPASSSASAVVLPAPPTSTAPPTITGTAQQGQTLTEAHGSWTNSPTSFAYQWLQCESLGSGCVPIAGAIHQTYVPVAEDVGHTLKVQETAANSGGSGSAASSTATAVVKGNPPPPPANTAPPTISGTPQQGQTLTEAHGTWTNSPTGFAYQWLQCDSSGNACTAIAAATGQTYVPVAADVAHTLKVQETAANSGGSGSPASSGATAIVQQQASSATFGKTTVGSSSDSFLADRKRVSRYALPSAGTVSKLSIYLAPTGTSGQQLLEGVIYADAGGAPGALLGTSGPLTFKSTNAAGWYDLVFSAALKLAAGNYWIGAITGASSNVAGFRYTSVSGARDYNANSYTSGPTNPFGAVTTDAEQASLYATYTTASDGTAPTAPQGLTATAVGTTQVNLSWTAASDNVGIAGYTIRRGGTVIAQTGSTATAYADSGLSPSTAYSYTVDAYDAAGNHSSQSQAAGATTSSSSSVQHYEYVFPSKAIDVYDMDNGHKLVKTISLPQAATDIRGAVASPTTGMLYVSYGGDGGSNGAGTILAYDLVKETTAWTHAYPEGVDSMAITPDGHTIYLPVGEASSASTWDVLDASTGNVVSTIQGGLAPHNTIVSLNGGHVYMGGREAKYLSVADTSTNEIVKQIGPLLPGGVRPFTINGKETLAFTTATGYLGFQVSSITSGQVLYTVPVSGSFPYTAGQAGPSSPSHGISLSPDEKQLWVIDQPNDYVHVFDITGLPASAPKQIADIKLTKPMTGSQVGCTYDCLREGWLQHSLDGRFVYVGDSGDVIDTKTDQSVANLEPLYNSRVYLEIDWSSGAPVATSSRTGMGYVTK